MANLSSSLKILKVFFIAFALALQLPFSLNAQSIKQIGYGEASYNASQKGAFMKNWLLAGPVKITTDTAAPSVEMQQKIFNEDLLSKMIVMPNKAVPSLPINNTSISWKLYKSPDDIVDLDSFYKKKDFVYAYALAEIKADAPQKVFFATGSDDAIRIWLNGKPVLDKWAARGVQKDSDLTQLNLEKGSNQLLIKVQDMQGGWGFVARMLDKAALTEQSTKAAQSGKPEMIDALLEAGADINGIASNGLSAITVAKLTGRDAIVQQLIKAGAMNADVPPGNILIDSMYSSLTRKDYPGMAVLVAKDGLVLYRKGFGYADIKDKIPVTPETKFRIGSVTKQFTAAAILKLQDEGRISVNDKLSKFIPDFPRADEVTIYHLLTHSSGIHSYTNNDDFLDKVTQPITPDSLVNLIKKGPYDFNPGDDFWYNNSGYFLLGYIIDKISGKSYAAYLKDNFFDPLQMNNTGIYHTAIQLTKEAKGYTKDGEEYQPALNWDMSWAGAAGAIYSTLDDLLKWNQALYGGKVIKDSSLKAATTTVLLNKGTPPMQYGYGLITSKYRGIDEISHSGGLHGFLSQLAYYPKQKMSVVIFTNTSDPEGNLSPDKIAEAFLWQQMDKQATYEEAAVQPKNLKDYVGRYNLAGSAVATITTENKKLYAQITGQGKYEIYSLATDEFFWKIVEAKIKFSRDEKDSVVKAILYQNGQEIVMPRLKEETVIELDPAMLDQYTGKYKLNDKLIVTIYKENNKLLAQPTGQARLQLEAIATDEFFIKEANIKLKFIKDPDGKVTTIRLNENGVNTNLPKIE